MKFPSERAMYDGGRNHLPQKFNSMSTSDPPASDPNADRVTNLEILLTHLQEDFRQLDSAVLDQQQQIDALSKTISRLEVRIDKLSEGPENRDPAGERPPHY